MYVLVPGTAVRTAWTAMLVKSSTRTRRNSSHLKWTICYLLYEYLQKGIAGWVLECVGPLSQRRLSEALPFSRSISQAHVQAHTTPDTRLLLLRPQSAQSM